MSQNWLACSELHISADNDVAICAIFMVRLSGWHFIRIGHFRLVYEHLRHGVWRIYRGEDDKNSIFWVISTFGTVFTVFFLAQSNFISTQGHCNCQDWGRTVENLVNFGDFHEILTMKSNLDVFCPYKLTPEYQSGQSWAGFIKNRSDAIELVELVWDHCYVSFFENGAQFQYFCEFQTFKVIFRRSKHIFHFLTHKNLNLRRGTNFWYFCCIFCDLFHLWT